MKKQRAKAGCFLLSFHRKILTMSSEKGHKVHYTFDVKISSREMKLEQTSKVLHRKITHLQMRRPHVNARGLNGDPMASELSWRSAYLTLKQRTKEFGKDIPLEDIILATENGLWYEIEVPNIDMAQSSIKITNEAAAAASVAAEEVFQLKFKYIEKD